MALNNMGLGFVFTARNLASGTIARLRGELGGLAGTGTAVGAVLRTGFATAAAGLVPLTAGLGILAGAMNLADAAGTFEQGLAGIKGTISATAEEMVLLREAAIQAGISTQYNPNEAIEGLTSLASAGLTARQSITALIPTLQLAASSNGQLGLEQASAAVVGTLNSQGLAADQAADVTNRLVRIANLTNFAMRDFEAGLAKASAGGAVFGQSLNDTLITMGLLRNRNIDASSSATAFGEATRRLASDAGAQAAAAEAQIQIFDEQTGAMRQLPDILLDMTERFKDMTEAERNGILAQTLGARGILAYNAVAGAQATVMRDGREVTLMGAEAIAYLREEMNNTAGASQEFSDALLDTFEGQKTLLAGVMDTFAIVLGEPFAKVFKPVLKMVVGFLQVLLDKFNSLPEGMKDFIAQVVVLAAALTSLSGVTMILTGLTIVLIPFFKAMAIAILAGLAVILPFVVATGLAIGAVVAFREAVDRNIGGLGDFFERNFNRVRLVFQGLVQLFTDGGFSGAVRDEMNAAGNGGLRQFVVNVFRFGSRIMEFLQGVSRGFSRALGGVGPTFERLIAAMTRLGEAFGFIDQSIGGMSSMDAFASNGIQLGQVLGNVFDFMVEQIINLTNFWTGFTTSFSEILESPVFGELRVAFTELGQVLGDLFAQFDTGFANSGTKSQSMGEVIGSVLGGIIRLMANVILFAVRVGTGIARAFEIAGIAGERLGMFFVKLGTTVELIFAGIKDSIMNALDTVIAFIGRLVGRMPAALRPAFADTLVSAGQDAERRQTTRNAEASVRVGQARAGFGAIEGLHNARAAARQNVANAENVQLAELTSLMRTERTNRHNAAIAPTVVNLQVDGQTLATVTANSNRQEASRGFIPGVPSDS